MRDQALPVAAFAQVGRRLPHRSPMLSPDTISDLPSLHRFFSTVRAGADDVAEPKINGLSVSPHYLVRALTRGDGLLGEDLTASVRGLNVPLCVHGFSGGVRGAAYLGFQALAAYNGTTPRCGWATCR
jgi:DNA ligase (NAD+)